MQKGSDQLNQEFRSQIRDEFSRRVRFNERYSLRSFAKHLGIDSSSLSKILSGKRTLSTENIDKLCKKIGVPNPNRSPVASDTIEFKQLDVDTFSVMADWYHFAILDLVRLKSFKSDPKWIARKLSIEPHQALGALERLKRLGLLVVKNGRLKRAAEFYTNGSDGMTSAALKEYQRQVVKKAVQAIDDCPQDRKDITSITVACNSKKLKEAKEKIKAFRREICALLETGDADSVFHLAVQLYPVTNLDN